jgi:hypothetical protein
MHITCLSMEAKVGRFFLCIIYYFFQLKKGGKRKKEKKNYNNGKERGKDPDKFQYADC